MIPVLKLNEQPSFQASKWLQVRVLMDAHELKNLFDALGEFFLVRITGVTVPGEGVVPAEDFLKVYSNYVGWLKEGKVPPRDDYCNVFNFAMTTSLDDLFASFVGEDKQLIRIRRPVIQIQEHTLDYSSYDHKFRSMVLGSDCITWGLQLSFPQLFQQPEDNEVVNVLTSDDYPNGALFRSLQKWVRRNTLPTAFEVEGSLIKTSIRLGKDCLEWINRHPQFESKKIKVSRGS